jgi:diadenosine tetraphosphatase ApaH/serine/threonine PP2A family protein phosphatase
VRLALIADVHANDHAIEAVIAAVRAESVDQVVCLGDVVGYNARPVEAIQRVREACVHVTLGNHDLAVADAADRPDGTHGAARAAQQWTRRALGSRERSYLRSLPRRVVEADHYVAVHGCYLNDQHHYGYVTTTMLAANLGAVMERGWPRVAFCGHTHRAMVGWKNGDGVHEAPATGCVTWPRAAEAVLVNPGSVGQPRDGDPRAAWALVDLKRRTVQFRREVYDVAASAHAVRAAGLDPWLATRLLEGR